MSSNDGGPAFPVTAEQFHQGFSGMTLRDRFAAAALAGQLANPKWPNVSGGLPAAEEECAAHWAYSFADAMLKERDR